LTGCDLRARVLEVEAPAPLDREFDEEGQLAVSTLLAQTFGYDMSIGRIDKAVHPFSSGSVDAAWGWRVDGGP